MRIGLVARHAVRTALIIRYVAHAVFSKLFWSHLFKTCQWQRTWHLALCFHIRYFVNDRISINHRFFCDHIIDIAITIASCFIAALLPIRIESLKGNERAYRIKLSTLPGSYPRRTKSVGIALVISAVSITISVQYTPMARTKLSFSPACLDCSSHLA